METENKYKNKVHQILAHAHAVYFLLFLLGLSLDMSFGFKVTTRPLVIAAGIVLLICGTVLILWTEMTSRNLKKDMLSKETFCRGPYCYTRTPTSWGLFLLVLGFGMIAGAVFVVLSTLVSLIIAKLIFQDKAEKVLAEKYGTPYLEYKKMVKF